MGLKLSPVGLKNMSLFLFALFSSRSLSSASQSALKIIKSCQPFGCSGYAVGAEWQASGGHCGGAGGLCSHVYVNISQTSCSKRDSVTSSELVRAIHGFKAQ